MNYLAHTFLSCRNDGLMVGNFIADFISNQELAQYDSSIQEGVRLHRQIDQFMDQHPEVLACTKLLHDKHHKYASVLIDVFFDHFLSIHWSVFSPEPLPVFTARVYQVFEAYFDKMPSTVQQRLPMLIAHDWLANYGTFAGLEKPMLEIARRVSQPVLIEGAIDSLKTHYEAMNDRFMNYFPQVMAFVDEVCGC